LDDLLWHDTIPGVESAFDWDDENVDHVSDHSIRPDEAEDALLDPQRIPAPAYSVRTEPRRAVLGTTTAGRLLLVVFAIRQGRIRVVTARDVTDRERRRYRQRGK